jgi:hypothetical protein
MVVVVVVVVVRVEVLYLPRADFRICELVNFSPIELPVSLTKNMYLSTGHNTQNKHSFIQQTEVLLQTHDLHESD